MRRFLMKKCYQATVSGWARGWTLHERFAIAFFYLFLSPSVSLLKSRPRARFFVTRLWPVKRFFHGRDGLFILFLHTPNGPARLVFDPLDDNECVVVEELLLEPIYLVKGVYSLLIDAGAFRGISTIYLQDQAKSRSVVAIEPGRKNYEELKCRLQKYLPKAIIHNVAVAAAVGEGSFTGEGIGGKLSNSGIKVQKVRIADIVELKNVPDALIKMDIEGAEAEVLPDLLPHLPEKCTIFLETHQPHAAAESLLDYCRKAGFQTSFIRSRTDRQSINLFIDWRLERIPVNHVMGGV